MPFITPEKHAAGAILHPFHLSLSNAPDEHEFHLSGLLCYDFGSGMVVPQPDGFLDWHDEIDCVKPDGIDCLMQYSIDGLKQDGIDLLEQDGIDLLEQDGIDSLEQDEILLLMRGILLEMEEILLEKEEIRLQEPRIRLEKEEIRLSNLRLYSRELRRIRLEEKGIRGQKGGFSSQDSTTILNTEDFFDRELRCDRLLQRITSFQDGILKEDLIRLVEEEIRLVEEEILFVKESIRHIKEEICLQELRIWALSFMLVLLLQRLLQLAWIPEFPNNFRHPCTTMPWTIWPALVVLWGVCWMFYNGEGVRDINNHAISQEFEIDWPWQFNDTGGLPPEIPFEDIDFNFGPAVEPPQIDFAVNDKQANAGLSNDGLWNRGVPPTVIQRDVSPTAAPQTQLNVRMEREVPLQLASASSGRTFNLRSGLRAHMNRHEKPFMCDICRQRFGSKKELQRHESSKHSDDKPFVCTWPQCKRSRQGWAREDNYRRHVRTVHHGEYGPTALPSRAGDVPNNSASRKRRREESEDDADSDFRSESRRKDERIRDLEERIEETKRICQEYKELYANSKEENIRLKEEIAQLKGLRASVA
ncbi:hypothetical protein DL770_002218 [Monosporascus sp. CRB-9-2]|nr:hypothetical protein DL770_002218 [Monosporascus sp. CRB-9-2]